MSVSGDHYQALRWIATAEDDPQAARSLERDGMYAHACFLAQQCAEEAVKAAWVRMGQDRWGHSIGALIRSFPPEVTPPQCVSWTEQAAAMDRYYIPRRYPNGLPDLTPGESYFAADARSAIELGERFLDASRAWLDAHAPGSSNITPDC